MNPLLRHDLFDHMAMYVGKPSFKAIVIKGESFVV
jgi:hypothetical protein